MTISTEPESFAALSQEIRELREERKAVILAHNYQRPEVQLVADHLGDSLGLSMAAAKTDAKVIVFCGVDFMAETAKILNPEKAVLHPDVRAKCPMAAMIDVEGLQEMKRSYQGVPVVAYVNTSAACKAEVDLCVTSSNALKVIKRMSEKRIIFVPDTNLALWVQRFVPDKELILWPGFCPTHHRVRTEDVRKAKEEHPEAEVVAHPECTPDVLDLADQVASTEGILTHIAKSPKDLFIVATEHNMLHRIQRETGKRVLGLPGCVCPNMAQISLADVRDALLRLEHRIELEPEILKRARIPVERMLAAGRGD